MTDLKALAAKQIFEQGWFDNTEDGEGSLYSFDDDDVERIEAALEASDDKAEVLKALREEIEKMNCVKPEYEVELFVRRDEVLKLLAEEERKA